MAHRNEVYKCKLCGNIVEVLTGGGGTLSCCGADMVLLSENTTDAAVEKHVPTVTKTDDGIVVNVGSVDHPMADDHFIEWIEVLVGGVSNKVFLQPGDKPQACFPANDGEMLVRAYCNLHGLWKAE
ncbi:MAG: desulfoferrodoxin [Desulfobulbaceae bacterium]|nr:desulfoferrodoxin [Desulfobulbaceae bacterium]